ncbi:MAG TPA: methyltransferase domain-containing protein [Candidatus Sulfotelmatobacter sp.]|nr:methyltransferase domain-containing protein [Candidatus Sulfotelmatobacter sp.]
MDSIQEQRNFYANFVASSAGSNDERLIAAFASVPRERFLGPPPWSIVAGKRYVITHEPRLLYQDVAVGLAVAKGINNGQPSLHSRCLVACAPVAGDSVVHIGAGTGYYTAILASLAGPTGQVIAYEIDADLAERARENLRDLPTVRVENASACQGALPEANVIYVSAGVTHPPATWLDALKVGGRLVFPLTPNTGIGVMLLITRRSETAYAAQIVSLAGFIGCVGGRSDAAAQALAAALQPPPLLGVKSLRRGTAPDATACCVGHGWWLSTAPPA